MIRLMLLGLLAYSAADLENSGRLVEAGAAWQEEGNLAGQVRVIGRLLEEALYAGDGRRAWLLAAELQTVCPDRALIDFWKARIAWTSGLSLEALSLLDSLKTDDPWLEHRAAGMAALFREDGEGAAIELLLSIRYGSTSRRRFWSALDLCSAYLSTGSYEEALALSELLEYNYTGDAMADVMYGLCLYANGRYAESCSTLSRVDGSDPAAEGLARILMEGFEQ